MLHVTINDKTLDCQPGTSILMALREGGIRVPTLCHDDRLHPTGDCRSCLVSLTDRSRLVTACTTTVEDGMVIDTHTPELEAHRRSLMQMLAWRYPVAAVEQFPDKPFHRLLVRITAVVR